MSSGKGIPDFPNVEAKLQKPAKQSAFERQRAEAEAKRQREAAETAAVYEDFVKSFDHDDDEADSHAAFPQARPRPGPGFSAGSSAPGASRRHFGTSGLKSGPGSLGPPPTSFVKKRSYQDFARGPRDAKSLLGFDDRDEGSTVPKAFDASDDEDMADRPDGAEEKAVAKPTMRLWDLPPGASPAMLKSLISEYLPVESVRLLPPAAPGSSERKSAQAVAIFSQETPSSDIESAVTSLKGRYLGYGYYLSLDRGPSTAIINSTVQRHNFTSTTGSHPFDAKPVEQVSNQSNTAVQHGEHRGYAPPSSYASSLGGSVNRSKILHVPVTLPRDIRTVQSINKVIEGVLEHGPEFEALLMSRPEVQREEKWAWIWNARSEDGIWYRWRLWEIITGASEARRKGRYMPLFEGSHAWKTPEEQLPFEHATQIQDFVSDSNYDTSDEDDLDEEGNRETQSKQEEKVFLNPLKKAKLVHLLARLPTKISKLRKGDVARVTTFAIANASRGSDEIVDLVLSNVEQPFSLTAANGAKNQESKEPQQGPGADDSAANEGTDASAASLVGLYVVSDILSSSSTTNVRHGWRYRPLLETALLRRKTFEQLGLMAEKLGWGRLRAEKWKRSIHLVLNLWEGWCSFAPGVHEQLVGSFDNPPSLKSEDQGLDSLKKGRWKAVEANPAQGVTGGVSADAAQPDASKPGEDMEGEPMEEDDVEGEPMGEEDVEGEPMAEEDVEGEPIDEDDVAGEPIDEDEVRDDQQLSNDTEPRSKPASQHDGRMQPRQRMRAVDMFADSEESDSNRNN